MPMYPALGSAAGTDPGGSSFADAPAAALEAATNWLNEPFTTPLDTVSIFLLVGVVAISVILWNMVLFHIRIAAAAIT